MGTFQWRIGEFPKPIQIYFGLIYPPSLLTSNTLSSSLLLVPFTSKFHGYLHLFGVSISTFPHQPTHQQSPTPSLLTNPTASIPPLPGKRKPFHSPPSTYSAPPPSSPRPATSNYLIPPRTDGRKTASCLNNRRPNQQRTSTHMFSQSTTSPI